jgi:hypothetical protein
MKPWKEEALKEITNLFTLPDKKKWVRNRCFYTLCNRKDFFDSEEINLLQKKQLMI